MAARRAIDDCQSAMDEQQSAIGEAAFSIGTAMRQRGAQVSSGPRRVERTGVGPAEDATDAAHGELQKALWNDQGIPGLDRIVEINSLLGLLSVQGPNHLQPAVRSLVRQPARQ